MSNVTECESIVAKVTVKRALLPTLLTAGTPEMINGTVSWTEID